MVPLLFLQLPKPTLDFSSNSLFRSLSYFLPGTKPFLQSFPSGPVPPPLFRLEFSISEECPIALLFPASLVFSCIFPPIFHGFHHSLPSLICRFTHLFEYATVYSPVFSLVYRQSTLSDRVFHSFRCLLTHNSSVLSLACSICSSIHPFHWPLSYRAKKPTHRWSPTWADHVWDQVESKLVLWSDLSWKQRSRQIKWGVCLNAHQIQLVEDIFQQMSVVQRHTPESFEHSCLHLFQSILLR